MQHNLADFDAGTVRERLGLEGDELFSIEKGAVGRIKVLDLKLPAPEDQPQMLG